MSKFSETDDNLILSAIRNNTTYRGILRELGLSAGEYNRKQLKQFISDNNIEFRSNYKQGSPLGQVSKEELTKIINESNTYTDVLHRLGYGKFLKGGAFATLRKRIREWDIDTSHMTHHTNSSKERVKEEEIFVLNSSHNNAVLRRYVLKHNSIPYECAICGNKGEWNNKPLSLTLDHINGNHFDNRKENLRFVCPNCDRQLDTYGKKNPRRYYKS